MRVSGAVGGEEVVLHVLLGDRRAALGGLATLASPATPPGRCRSGRSRGSCRSRGPRPRASAFWMWSGTFLRGTDSRLPWASDEAGQLGLAVGVVDDRGLRRRRGRWRPGCRCGRRRWRPPRPRAPRASAADRATQQPLLAAGTAGGCRGRPPSDPGTAGAAEGDGWPAFGSARDSGLRWLCASGRAARLSGGVRTGRKRTNPAISMAVNRGET